MKSELDAGRGANYPQIAEEINTHELFPGAETNYFLEISSPNTEI